MKNNKNLRRKGGYRLKQTSPSRVKPKKSQIIIVDFFNLFLGIKEFVLNGELRNYYWFNYPNFLEVLVRDGHSLLWTYVYILQSEEFRREQSRFLKKIADIQVVEIQPIEDEIWQALEYKPQLVDIKIRNELAYIAQDADLITLVSGDGGFMTGLEGCLDKGKQVEVVAYSKFVNGAYLEHPDIKVRTLEDVYSRMHKLVVRGDLRLSPLQLERAECGCI